MDIQERLETVENTVKMAGLVKKEVLTFDEAATFTGMSKSYLYKQTAQKNVPHYKPAGKLVYFNRAELESWLLQNRVSTTDEITSKAVNYCMTKKGDAA